MLEAAACEQHLAADREADTSDPTALHVGPSLQPGDGGVDVFGAAPSEQVRVTIASVVAARVEQEHAVAVADEHPRLRRASPGGSGTR